MTDPLDDYRRKRDFDRTPEPAAGGVLCSWAVPKGFSYDPGEKRLAVRTEDHPLAYEHFSGRIPKGQYGAGTMAIWDRGSYALVKAAGWDEAMARGELKFVLRGRRLRGEWHLVRTQQGPNTWLLFKSRDVYAGPARDSALGIDLDAAPAAALPADLAPMRCARDVAPFRDPTWSFELEFAGRRCFAERDGSTVRLGGLAAPPAAVRAGLLALRCERATLDGVLVALDANGRPNRAALDDALGGAPSAPVAYYAFDLLQWEDYDLRPLPLLDRKQALRGLIAPQPGVLYVDHVVGHGPALLDAIAAAGLEAAIAKRSDSAYTCGASDAWRRVVAAAPPGAAGAAPAAPARMAVRSRPTNLAKVYWPAEGHTKGDLLAYYHKVADVLLPHLRDRPVHLNRFPDGIDGKSFYQREAKPGTPAWVRTVPIERDGELVPHHVIDDLETLLYVVNLGSIDLHPWLSRTASLDAPDWAVLDLDPKSAPFPHVVRIARAAGRLLRGIGLRPLVKTSGKSGLHVFVPLRPGYTYDQSRMFVEAVARVLTRELADVATIERLPDRREGKVYLDFLQNRRGQTVVPPYCVRPVRGATVSTPLAWDELEDGDLSPQRFTLQTVPGRIAAHGDLFRPALEDRQDLLPAIDALGDVLRRR